VTTLPAGATNELRLVCCLADAYVADAAAHQRHELEDFELHIRQWHYSTIAVEHGVGAFLTELFQHPESVRWAA
jgi:hypothetical protein